MTDQMIIEIGGFLVILVTLIKPMMNINSSMTELSTTVKQIKEMIQEVKDRVTTHGQEIDFVKEKLIDHEARIKALEKK